MGVVNVTPDSFSDGGVNFRREDAVAAARRMLDGGRRDRRRRRRVDAARRRGRLARRGAAARRAGARGARRRRPVSIDTAKAEVARRALELGAELVNDVTALRGDPELAGVVADSDAYLCLMHMQGEPRTMQASPTLRRRRRRGRCVPRGAARASPSRRASRRSASASTRASASARPSSRTSSSCARLDELVALGRPVLVGLSRKRSLGRILGDPEATTGPLSASIAAAVAAYERGATIFRVHDVREHVEALTVAARRSR